MTDQLLNLKMIDPLVGCLAGYTLVRLGESHRYRGVPVLGLPPNGWNPRSAMQNMLNRFELLPDAHVLAGLCEEERREEHFAAAVGRGIPLFTEGFRVLLDHFRERRAELPVGMWHARRTLAAGSAFSAWIGYEPVLEVSSGTIPDPPAAWAVLSNVRSVMERQLRATGAVHIQSADTDTYRTGFLVAPDLILTADHVIQPVLDDTDGVISLRPGTSVTFVQGDGVNNMNVARYDLAFVAIDNEARIALLRLPRPLRDAVPLLITPSGAYPERDRRVYLIGYPFLQNDLDPALVEHVFGKHTGVKRVQPGFIVAAPRDRRGFDHDAFTMGGSAGSPVIDLETGVVLGVHWGGMVQANFKRGRAASLFKPENCRILVDAGVLKEN